jgi:hypothetical protein
MVRTAMSTMRADVYPEDRQVHEKIMRRTRVVIMGRRTMATTYKGRSVFTVPVLLECQSKVDAGELDAILRRAGYFSAFHWPQEILEFVNGVREEVRKMGYKDQTHYVRIRPEEKGGCMQIRADVKEKNGGRFQAKAVWQCPPLNQQLWDGIEGLYEPRMLGGGGEGTELLMRECSDRWLCRWGGKGEWERGTADMYSEGVTSVERGNRHVEVVRLRVTHGNMCGCYNENTFTCKKLMSVFVCGIVDTQTVECISDINNLYLLLDVLCDQMEESDSGSKNLNNT